MQYFTLSNGVQMPVTGVGVFQFTPDEAEYSVRTALEHGIRLVDTANRYMNERGTGRGIRSSGIPREDIFLVSKLSPTQFTYDYAIDETLKRLGTDYLDLLFLHHPTGDWRYAYRMLEKAYREDKIRAIGLSNFPEVWLREIDITFDIPVHAAQEEVHPYFTQIEYKKALAQRDIALMAYNPLGHGDPKLLSEPVFVRLAEQYGKTPAQIILRWHLQMQHIAIPAARREDHIVENFDIFDFELSDQDMADIAVLDTETPYHPRTLEGEQEYIFIDQDFNSQK